MKHLATNFYTQRQGNCAQAVSAAWATKTPQYNHLHEEMAVCGSGKAPGGLCGAWYAATRLIPTERQNSAASVFAEQSGGHLTCRDIRLARQLPCAGCVALAAELVEQHHEPA